MSEQLSTHVNETIGHQLYRDSFLLKNIVNMSEFEVRSKATEYKRLEKYGGLNERQESERARLFGHFVFELAMQVREREQLEKSLGVL